MNEYRYAFFDLDGTITDSAPGITACVQYALRKLGIDPPPAKELTCFIGPTLFYGFSTFCHLDEVNAHRAVDFYRERYSAGGMFECEIYDGIENTLKELNTRGIPCVLATCKPHIYADQIIAYFGLDKYFTLTVGPELDGTRNEKHEVIAYAMEQLGITSPSEILMIGDRDNDVIGSKKNNVDCLGVLWGFGSEAELLENGAKYIIEKPSDILNYFNA